MSGTRRKFLRKNNIIAVLEEIPEDYGEGTDIETDEEVDGEDFESNNDELSQLLEQVINGGEEVDATRVIVDEEAAFEEILRNDLPSTSKNNFEPNYQWKLKDHDATIPEFFMPEGPVSGYFESLKTPTEYFISFIDSIVEGIISQSNLYATQQNRILNLQKNEFLAFVGINFFMGYHRLPSWKDYWSTNQDLGIALVSNTMSRNRFEMILRYLHCNDNTLIQKTSTDRLLKIRPVINGLNQKFQDVYNGTRQLSVDESMILFKGRNTMKQYCPMKPIKRGYKMWCLADQKGYIKRFSIYQGKDVALEDKYDGFGLGERVVLSLTENERGKNKMIFFDNYFTSIRLLEKLKTEQILACGTIRSNRKFTPQNLKPDKKMKRGDWDFRVSTNGISYYKWMDRKGIYLASNFHGSESTTVSRGDHKGEKSEVACPVVIKDYNNFMGGVDQADQLRSFYAIDRKSKKWWHRIFWALVEVAFVNSHIVFCQQNEKISLYQYRRSVAQGLMTFKKLSVNKRSSRTDHSTSSNKRRRGKTESVTADVRLGNLGVHWPIFGEARGRCELCSIRNIQSRPYSKCRHCGVFLCCNDKKNCFTEYHGIS